MIKDNRGFAITTIIYGIFILFMFLLVSILGMLSNYSKNVNMLIDNQNGARDRSTMEPICLIYQNVDEYRRVYVRGTILNRTECLEKVRSGLYCFGSTNATTCSNNCYYVPRKRVCN